MSFIIFFVHSFWLWNSPFFQQKKSTTPKLWNIQTNPKLRNTIYVILFYFCLFSINETNLFFLLSSPGFCHLPHVFGILHRVLPSSPVFLASGKRNKIPLRKVLRAQASPPPPLPPSPNTHLCFPYSPSPPIPSPPPLKKKSLRKVLQVKASPTPPLYRIFHPPPPILPLSPLPGRPRSTI